MSSSRKSFLLSMTLTELSLLLFFLLLFVAVRQIIDLASERDLMAERSAAFERQMRGNEALWAEQLDMSREEASTLLRDAADIAGERTELIELRREVESLLAEIPNASDDRFVELVRQAAMNRAADRQNEQMLARVDSLSRLAAQFENINLQAQNLRGQLANMRRRAEQAGFGFPPCWATPEGDIEYLYRVLVNRSEISVAAEWPAHRNADAQAVPGAIALLADNLSPGEFAQRSKPVLDWSKAQDPECRHFVRIHRGQEMTEETFQNILLVEDYFYKYLSRFATQ